MRLVVKQVRLNYCETEGAAPVPSALMVAGKDLPWYDTGSLAFGWGSVKWELMGPTNTISADSNTPSGGYL